MRWKRVPVLAGNTPGTRQALRCWIKLAGLLAHCHGVLCRVRESVDITRLSHAIRGRMHEAQEEAAPDTYSQAKASTGDIKLANADAELVFHQEPPGMPFAVAYSHCVCQSRVTLATVGRACLHCKALKHTAAEAQSCPCACGILQGPVTQAQCLAEAPSQPQ